MSNITKYLLLCIGLLLCGCRKSEPSEVYENHNIEACGIQDPINNTPWLNQYCQGIKAQKDISYIYLNLYSLYRFDRDKDSLIGTDTLYFRSEIRKKKDNRIFYEYRDCGGTMVHEYIKTFSPEPEKGQCYIPPPPDFWLEDKELRLIGEVFRYVK